MDPNQWANFSQTYSRLPTSAQISTSTHRFDLPQILDQSVAPAGVSALPVPIPAHTSLNTPRLANARAANHTQATSGVTSQQLEQANAGQFKLKQVQASSGPVAPQSMTESTRTVNVMPRSLTPPAAHLPPRSNVYDAGRCESTTIQQLLMSGQGDGAGNVQESHKTNWGVSFASSQQQTQASLAGSEQLHVLLHEPPPAHSGVRPASIQKNVYIPPAASSKMEYLVGQHNVSTSPNHQQNDAVPQSALTLNVSQHDSVTAHRTSLVTYPSQVSLPIAHSPSSTHYSQVSQPSQQYRSIISAIPSTSPSSQLYNPVSVHQLVSSHPSFMSDTPPSHQPQQPPQQQPQVVYTTYTSPVSTANTITYNTMMDMKYEAVSPPPPDHTPNTIIASQAFNTGMSLQDLADISSSQEKIPLHSQQNQQHTSQLVTELQQAGLHRFQQPLFTIQRQQQEQVRLEGSHVSENPNATSQSSLPPQHLPVQAVADSTTKKGRRGSGARKVGGATNRKRKNPQHTTEDVSLNKSPMNPLLYTEGNTYETISAQDLASFGSSNPPFSDPIPLAHEARVAGKEETIFMTSHFENALISAPEVLLAGAVVNEDSQGSEVGLLKNQQHRQLSVPEFNEVDDEFSHLAPQIISVNSTKPSVSDAILPKAIQGVIPSPKLSGFQDSFLSFLEGKKPETLSSVTNNLAVKRPILPKYVPDPRPAVRAEERKQQAKLDDSKVNVGHAPPANQVPQHSKSLDISYSNSGSGLPLSDGKSSENIPPKKIFNSLSSSRGMSTVKRGRPKQGTVGKASTSTVTLGQAVSLSGSEDNELSDSEDEEGMSYVDRPTSKGRVKCPGIQRGKCKKKQRDLSPVTPRQRTVRKAKQKVEEKRLKKLGKKYGDKFESDEDLSELDSASGEEPPTYDSDKDPVWNPYGIDQDMKVLSWDEEMRGITTAPATAPRVCHRASTPASEAADELPVAAMLGPHIANPDLPDDWDEPHTFPKGSFVLDRRDEFKHERFDIWRVDAGRLLQKFEGVMEGDRLIHKATSTYSSWSDTIQRSHKAIGVMSAALSGGDIGEQVEVIDKYRPHTPDDRLEEEPLMQSFNVYMQTLVSQALDPQFLTAIHQEQDEYYLDALKTIDSLLQTRQKTLILSVQWTDEFKVAMDELPTMLITPKSNLHSSCQVSLSGNFRANYVIQLRGDPYNFHTLEKVGLPQCPVQEFAVSEAVVYQAKVYHRLRHYKHNLHRHCRVQVNTIRSDVSEISDILDQCLQNRAWVQQHFQQMTEILEDQECEKDSQQGLPQH